MASAVTTCHPEVPSLSYWQSEWLPASSSFSSDTTKHGHRTGSTTCSNVDGQTLLALSGAYECNIFRSTHIWRSDGSQTPIRCTYIWTAVNRNDNVWRPQYGHFPVDELPPAICHRQKAGNPSTRTRYQDFSIASGSAAWRRGSADINGGHRGSSIDQQKRIHIS